MRQIVRERLVELYTATGSFSVVCGYLPMDLLGATSALAIYNKKTGWKIENKATKHDFYSYWLDVLVKRENEVATEDTLDSLHEVVRAVMAANIDDVWDTIETVDASEPLFTKISDVPYRVEQFTLTVKVRRI